MLIQISNATVSSAYASQAVPAVERTAGDTAGASQDSAATDTVSVSREAQSLQKAYEQEEDRLKEKYASEADQLEQEFEQEKSRLEQEYDQKKKSLGISLVV